MHSKRMLFYDIINVRSAWSESKINSLYFKENCAMLMWHLHRFQDIWAEWHLFTVIMVLVGKQQMVVITVQLSQPSSSQVCKIWKFYEVIIVDKKQLDKQFCVAYIDPLLAHTPWKTMYLHANYMAFKYKSCYQLLLLWPQSDSRTDLKLTNCHTITARFSACLILATKRVFIPFCFVHCPIFHYLITQSASANKLQKVLEMIFHINGR